MFGLDSSLGRHEIVMHFAAAIAANVSDRGRERAAEKRECENLKQTKKVSIDFLLLLLDAR